MLSSRFLVAPALLVALIAGCAVPAGPPHGRRAPTWPYAGIGVIDQSPAELGGFAKMQGSWMTSDPPGLSVLAETSFPRYLVNLPFQPGRARTFYLDLGPGAFTENADFSPIDDRLFLVSAVASPHREGSSVVARAVLEIDRRNWILLDATPLSRDAVARGFVLNRDGSRAYVYEDDGGGTGVVRLLDLYRGETLLEIDSGSVPRALQRKGLTMDRDRRTLFILVGGETSRSDFDPVVEDPLPPAVVAVTADSLQWVGTVDLPPNFDAKAIAADPDREHLVVLMSDYRRSVLVVIDAGFLTVRSTVELPEDTSDLVLEGDYAFAPGSTGIYIVDLVAETWVSRPGLAFDQTGEMAVSGDLSVAMVQFHSAVNVNGAAVAVVNLQTGSVIEVLN